MQLDYSSVQRDWEKAMARHLTQRPPETQQKRLERERVKMLMDLNLAAKRQRQQLELDRHRTDLQQAQAEASRLEQRRQSHFRMLYDSQQQQPQPFDNLQALKEDRAERERSFLRLLQRRGQEKQQRQYAQLCKLQSFKDKQKDRFFAGLKGQIQKESLEKQRDKRLSQLREEEEMTKNIQGYRLQRRLEKEARRQQGLEISSFLSKQMEQKNQRTQQLKEFERSFSTVQYSDTLQDEVVRQKRCLQNHLITSIKNTHDHLRTLSSSRQLSSNSNRKPGPPPARQPPVQQLRVRQPHARQHLQQQVAKQAPPRKDYSELAVFQLSPEKVHYNAARERSNSSMSLSRVEPMREEQTKLLESNRMKRAVMMGWY